MNDVEQTSCIIILMVVIPPLWYLSWRSRRRMARHIDAQDEAIRILTKPPEPPDRDKPRHGLTLHQGGRVGASALPLLWLWRFRPRPTALVATTVAMGVAYSAVTAIAVPPSTHPGAWPPQPAFVIPAATAPPSVASPPTASASPPAKASAPVRPGPRTAASSTSAPARTPTSPSTGPSASPAPTPSSPPPTTPAPSRRPTGPAPTPTRCLVTIGVGGIIQVCLP